MYRITVYIFLLMVAFGFSMPLQAQDKKTITAEFNNTPFDSVIRKASAINQSPIYFPPGKLDSIKVTIQVKDMPLSQFIEQILQNTAYHFFTDKSGAIFIVEKKYSIQTSLPSDFFETSQPVKETEDNTSTETRNNNPNKQPIDAAANKLYEIGAATNEPLSGSATLVGYVRDIRNGEGLAGAAVYLEGTSSGVITDAAGYYSLTIPKGRHVLQISSTGMKATRREIILRSNGSLTIELKEDIPTLKTVTVVAERNSNVRRMQMGIERISIKTIKQVPVLLGEPDVLRVLLTLPGVTSVGEASTGFNVRGGSSDQNLILFDEATVYNPSHVFGFFSAFNPDAIKNAELYKSSIPERFGGRLSSVLDITTREGNSKKWSGTGGIGLLTSKFTIEGPLVKEKTTLLASGRTTYSNWLLKQLPSEYNNSQASFYDLNLRINHTFNSKNTLSVTAYTSKDGFRLNNDTTYTYSNRNLVMKWKHVFNNKLYMNLTGGMDHYDYNVTGDKNSVRSYELAFGINQYHGRADFNYAPNNDHLFNFGVSSINYKMQPGTLTPKGNQSLVIPDKLNPEQARETAIYFGDKININTRLSVQAGIRYTLYQYLGAQTVYNYIDGLPRDESTRTDSTVYGAGKTIKTYHGPEIRLSLRYIVSDNGSFKWSYNTLRQYIHLLSNTTAISPTDVWKLSDPYLKPQSGDQFSMGYYQNFSSNTIETSVEVYYKRIKNFADYKSGASIVMNHSIETSLINTKGKAWGAEFMIRKPTGKLNGWISYTYSRIQLKMDDSLAGQQINKGEYYPANFDKPHAVNAIANYKFSHRYSVSMNAQYSTGRPITLPIAVFNLGGSQRVYYSERNQFRIPDYFRMDFALNIEGNHKVKKATHNSWSVGLYNMTGRKNVYSIYFVEENGVINGYKLSVIGTIIPYVTFNIKF